VLHPPLDDVKILLEVAAATDPIPVEVEDLFPHPAPQPLELQRGVKWVTTETPGGLAT
jgi:hypothetical protein